MTTQQHLHNLSAIGLNMLGHQVDYYLQTANGQQAGPYSLDQIRAFWANGQITLDTPCWTALSGWRPIRYFAGQIDPRLVQPLPSLPRVAPRAQPAPSGFGRLMGGCLLVVALVVGIPILMFVGAVAVGVAGGIATPDDPAVAAIYDASTDAQAMQVAQKFVVGTWTFTSPNQFWQKWVIREDGTVLAYTANERDSGWGKPTVYDWDLCKSKYTDSGEVYYAFKAIGKDGSSGRLLATIEKNGTLEAVSMYDTSVYATLKRGDDAHFQGN